MKLSHNHIDPNALAEIADLIRAMNGVIAPAGSHSCPHAAR